jgi:hypothetical protein
MKNDVLVILPWIFMKKRRVNFYFYFVEKYIIVESFYF